MKNTLLAVVGLSPQVVMETLYALHQFGRRVDAIHLITTRAGKETIFSTLLPAQEGRYYRYLNEYNMDADSISFGYDHIHVVTDVNGNEIEDIESEEDNERLIRLCLEMTFKLTADPDTAVFFSIAGGRKTMSVCLMLAAQLYGRPQDRVYHVLISPEFESNRDFFYPPRQSTAIELCDRNNQPYYKETRYSAVNLVPIPLLSVREQLSRDELRQAPKEPASLLLNLVREEPFLLTIDLAAGKLSYRKREMDLMPARLALYAFFALRKKQCPRISGQDRPSPNQRANAPDDTSRDASGSTISCKGCRDCFLDFPAIATRQSEITELYRQTASGREFTEMSDSGILGLTAENFNSYKGKIRRNLERAFGAQAAAQLQIASQGRRPDTRYGLMIDRERIRIVL